MRIWDLRENPRNFALKYSFKLAEEEREDVEKKVGEALDENFTALAEREKKKRGDSTGILYTRPRKISVSIIYFLDFW
jgi:hypothetical protein